MGQAPASDAACDWGWWRERRPPAQRLYLDTAAVGRSSRAILAATAAHAEREATTGAYVAQEEAGPVLAAGRAGLPRPGPGCSPSMTSLPPRAACCAPPAT